MDRLSLPVNNSSDAVTGHTEPSEYASEIVQNPRIFNYTLNVHEQGLLPLELYSIIMEYMSRKDLMSMRLVSKAFKHLSEYTIKNYKHVQPEYTSVELKKRFLDSIYTTTVDETRTLLELGRIPVDTTDIYGDTMLLNAATNG